MREKAVLSLKMDLEKAEFREEGGLVYLPRSTMLTEGTYNGITFLREELEKAEFPEVLPLNINHSRDIEDEVGFWVDVSVEDGKIRGVPVINLETAKGPAALGYVKNRKAAGLTAEVSVEVWFDGEKADGRFIARNLFIQKASLVDIGACGPGAGCGVGLSKCEGPTAGLGEEEPTMTEEMKGIKGEEFEALRSELEGLRAEAERLRAENEELKKERDALAERVKEFEEKERLAVLEEIRKFVPDFEDEGQPKEVLDTVLAALRKVKKPAERKTRLAKAEAEDPKEAYIKALRAELDKLRRG